MHGGTLGDTWGGRGKGRRVYMCVLHMVILPDHFKFASYGPALYVVTFTCQDHSSLLAYTLDRRIKL